MTDKEFIIVNFLSQFTEPMPGSTLSEIYTIEHFESDQDFQNALSGAVIKGYMYGDWNTNVGILPAGKDAIYSFQIFGEAKPLKHYSREMDYKDYVLLKYLSQQVGPVTFIKETAPDEILANFKFFPLGDPDHIKQRLLNLKNRNLIKEPITGHWIIEKPGIHLLLEREKEIENKRNSESKNTVYATGNISIGNLNQGSRLVDSPITHNVTTTPKIKDKITNWYTSPLYIYFIWPMLVLLIGAYIVHRLGWV